MNAKLTESEYQHMIMELIMQSIERIPDLRQSGNEDMVDWIFFIERLKVKGIMGDLKLVKPNTTAKANFAARQLRLQFSNDNSDKYITMKV